MIKYYTKGNKMPILKNIRVTETVHYQLKKSALHNKITLQEQIELIVKQFYNGQKHTKYDIGY